MGREYDAIDERIQDWIDQQHMFFVSTAPNSNEGLINCSPKGLDGLRVLGPRKMVYADLGGSGIETVAHVKENGRIVIMLCAFEGPPKIFRFYGQGKAIEKHDSNFDEYSQLFSHLPNARNFVEIEITLIRDACGFGVPLYDFKADREKLKTNFERKTPEQRRASLERNETSLDGLPGLTPQSKQ